MLNYKIIELNKDNIVSIESFKEESIEEGAHMVKRTLEEWKSGENTFSKRGERLWSLFVDDKCIAMGGLNIDPFVENNDGSIGRVRHLYVSRKYRRQGLAKVLMNLIINEAKKNFKTLRLSARRPEAFALYESMGFKRVEGEKVTHVFDLR